MKSDALAYLQLQQIHNESFQQRFYSWLHTSRLPVKDGIYISHITSATAAIS